MADTSTPEATAPLLDGASGQWELIVGLEVHAQVTSEAKLFSSAPTHFGAAPNTNVALVDAAMPGMLPVINQYCVEQAIRTGLGLGATINMRSVFDRKNYFYPDLPQGYQISQFSQPIVGAGRVDVELESGAKRSVGIVRLHLEQDAGKSMHDQDPNATFVDLNRCGVALMEIVTEPDMRSAEEAGAFMRKLRTILRYLGTCDGNMEQGSLRADVNVSVRRPGEPLTTRCEIKNLNSIRFVQQAIRSEAQRQITAYEAGEEIHQETRLFDTDTGTTHPMRSKEESHDYRYFPDPDLLPLDLDPNWVEQIRATLPELPDSRQARFVSEYGLAHSDAAILVEEPATANYFETAATGRDPLVVANWIVNELFGYLNKAGQSIEDCPVTADQLGQLVDMLARDEISGRTAKSVFAKVWETGRAPAAIVADEGLGQVTDTDEIASAVDQVIQENPEEVARVAKKPSLAGWFVGQVMKETGGRADPKQVNQLVREKLGIK